MSALFQLRLVCRRFADLASAVVDRSVWFPVMTELSGLIVCGPQDLAKLYKREEGARMHTIELLHPTTAGRVRRFCLGGINPDLADPIEDTTYSDIGFHHEIAKARVQLVLKRLENATALEELM